MTSNPELIAAEIARRIPEMVIDSPINNAEVIKNLMRPLIQPDRNMEVIRSLEVAKMGSCSCVTKTPDHRYHQSWCSYRNICEAIEMLGGNLNPTPP